MFSKVVLALAMLAGSASALLYTSHPESQKYMWEQFKQEYSKNYATMEEETQRFGFFVDNLKLADERNAADSATYGITKFSDMSQEEFKRTHLTYKPRSMENRTWDMVEALPEGVQALKDWTGVLTTPVKDQGYCGSCWAFSATEQIESDYIRQYGDVQVLSAQQITSCTGPAGYSSDGCNGGWTEDAFNYAKGGLELDSDYPYTSGKTETTGTCKTSKALYVVKTTGYTTVSGGQFFGKENEAGMASYVQSTGPLSVCVDAESWSLYTGGIMSRCGTSVDHCVQAVGIDTANGYWKVRNSWGTSWGESGYIRLAYGADTCAIASDANYASTAGM